MPRIASRAAPLLPMLFAGCVLACALPLGAQQAAGGASAGPVVVAPEPEPAMPPTLAAALRSSRLPPSAVGIYVQDVASGKPLLSVNADRPMNPASVMKLVTTYSALELLGPAYTWKTRIYETGVRRGDILEGDLVIKGAGDPKLTEEELWLALKAVRARGIREVRGNVVLDRGVFDASSYDAARFDGDPLRAYNAGPDGLLINFKALQLTFAPDEAGGAVNVTVEPRVAGLPMRGAVRLTQGPCADLRGPQMNIKVDPTGITADGAYSAACGVKTLWVHPFELSADQYVGAVLRQLWLEVGGSFTGEVKSGVLPAGARLLYEIESESLAETVRDINKNSNNVMARQLFLSISNEIMRLPGTPERSARAVKSWVVSKGIGGDDLVMENGSGLSRIERIAPQTLGRMLVAAYRSPVMPEFISSMPLVAYDGTMRRRLQTKDVAGQAHIKTGTLNNVRAIGGYVLAASGRRYAVVCLVNSPAAAGAQGLQDALLQWVYSEG